MARKERNEAQEGELQVMNLSHSPDTLHGHCGRVSPPVHEKVFPANISMPSSPALEDCAAAGWRRVIRKNGGTCSLECFAQQHPNTTLKLHPSHSLPPTHLGNVLREVVVPLAKLPWCSHRCFFALEKCERDEREKIRNRYRLAFISPGSTRHLHKKRYQSRAKP